MVWLSVLIGMILLGALQASAPSTGVTTKSHSATGRRSSQPSSQLWRHPVCPELKPEQTVKLAISPSHPDCFVIDVTPRETWQLVVSQPEDLEIHVSGESSEGLVDGFDMGNETVTFQTAGSYRVRVDEVKGEPGDLTISASVRVVPRADAAAWVEAEKWATMSKRSRKLDSINQSLTLWTQLGDTVSVARTYLKRESVLRSDYAAAARADAEKALELCLAISDLRCAAEAANNSGFDATSLGDVDSATRRLQDAAKDWGMLADPLNEAKTRSNIGLLFWQSGDFEQAIVFDNQAKAALRRKDAVGYAKILNNLGLCYVSLAEYEKAQGYFETAIATFANYRTLKDLVRARLNLARTYMLQKRLLRAELLLGRVLADAKALNDHRATADALRNLGQTLWTEGSIEAARTRFEEALEIDQSDGDRRGQSSALQYLGLIARKTGDAPAARDLFLQALNIRRASGLRDDATESLSALADLEYRNGRPDAARNFAEQALKLLESVRSQVPSPALRASFYSRKRQFFDLLVDIAMALGIPSANVDGLLAAERGRARALMDLLAGDSLLRQLPADLVQRRDSIQRQLDYLACRLSLVPPEQQDVLRGQIQSLIADDEQVEAQIRQTSGSKLGEPLQSIEEIRDHLPADSALLEFYLGARQSYLWLVDHQQIRVFMLPPVAVIEAQASPMIRWFGQILERRRSPAKEASFKDSIRNLSATLLGPLSGVPLPQRIILVPDGVLHRIPVAVLRLPNAPKPIGISHDLVQVPSAAYLAIGKHARPESEFPQTILAVVDPVFSSDDPRVLRAGRKTRVADPGLNLARLPFTGELRVVQTRVAASRQKILRGFDASREMLGRVSLEDFAVLHFSTHAVIDDQIPELSRIMLSMVDRAGRSLDGVLRPYHLAQLHLNGSIVVLSACETAMGKQVLGEGLAGLTNSLLFSGGSQLVLTLAPVDAEASSEFFAGVYRRFFGGPASMEHAITLTRRAMAQSRRYSDPYYWASFIVVGRPADGPILGAVYNRN